VRERVKEALDEQDRVGDGAGGCVPSRIPSPPTLMDECPVCGAELRIYDRCWLDMKTPSATLACANYCGPACYEESERRPTEVLTVLRRRQRLAQGGSL